MKKRITAFALSLSCIGALASCGSGGSPSSGTAGSSSENTNASAENAVTEVSVSTTETVTEAVEQKEKKPIKSYEKRHFNVSGDCLYREDYSYNDNGQLESYILWTTANTNTVVYMTTVQYEYDGSGKLVKSTRTFTDNKDAQQLMYDIEKKEGFYKYGFGFGNTAEEAAGNYYSVDEYNDEGWITSTKRYSKSGGNALLSEVVYEYEDKTTQYEGGLMGPKTIWVTMHVQPVNGDSTGTRVEIFSYNTGRENSWNYSDWSQKSKAGRTDKFNNDGTVAYSTAYDGTEQLVGGEFQNDSKSYEIRYTYDEYDNILTEKKYLMTGQKINSQSGSASGSGSSTKKTVQPPKMTLPDIESYGTLDSYVEYKYTYQ